MFMPRYLSRITLEIVDVRVEPLQDITDHDALEEGISLEICQQSGTSPVENYRELWDSLNADRGFPWMDNPWVYVMEFKRITQPVTAFPARKQSAAFG